MLFEPPTIKEYTHSCCACDYTTSILTKASHGMPRHKANGEWCDGSGKPPHKSVLQSERTDLEFQSRSLRMSLQHELGKHDHILEN